MLAVHAFLFALFDTAADYFENIDQFLPCTDPPSTLAEKIWLLMGTPERRKAFYSKVVEEADKVRRSDVCDHSTDFM